MLDADDSKYLERRLAQNDVVLFLGAGFSAGATNRIGQQMPLSREISEALWGFLRYDGEYDTTPLPDMYQALLGSGRPHAEIQAFLEERLLTQEIPGYYDNITKPFWFRIYTTNVDDLLPRVYKRVPGATGLEVTTYPREVLRERDQGLGRIQAVFLHGQLPCRPDEITFSVRQFARRAGEQSPLYEQFVGDYATKPTVFIGTELNEPLFWKHLEAREARSRGSSEQRPKSFLVAPRVSPPKLAQLEPLNVTLIQASTQEFLDWLGTVEHPTRVDVLKVTMPAVVRLLALPGTAAVDEAGIRAFGNAFHLVPTEQPSKVDRSFYLLGATPRWEDILRDLDAPRVLTQMLLERVETAITSGEGLVVGAITGSAGCGKSTILRRLGVRLSQAGRLTFLTNSEDLPAPQELVQALSALPQRSVLLFDNGEIALPLLPELLEAVKGLPNPPIVIVGCRANEYERRGIRLQKVMDVEEYPVDHLSRDEVLGVLRVLEEQGLLGHLQGLSLDQRIAEFESRERAGKQLLVAMREATSGKGFDEIIRNEFDSLEEVDAKLAYLFVALATDAGYRISRAQVVRASGLTPGDVLHVLERRLRGIVIPTGTKLDLLVLRHRVIAAYTLDRAAARTLVAQAYKALLPVLAADITGRAYRSTTFGLFRDLLNHRQVFERFESDLEEARQVYESVEYPLRTESHFWLQYGLLELDYGNLDFAENYLRQAESLSPKSHYIRNSIGHLYLKHAARADTETSALQWLREGSEILLEQMERDDSPYPYHSYCSQRLAWLHRWVPKSDARKEELEHLRDVIARGKKAHPQNGMIRRLAGDIEREYLGLVL